MSRRTTLWVAVAVGVYLMAFTAARLLEFDPDPLLLAAVVALVAALAWLMVVAVRDESTPWRIEAVGAVRQPGHDARFASYVRIVESHLHAREPDGVLRDRLAGIAERTLEIRHGLTLDDPRTPGVLGPQAMAVVQGPVRRLTLPEIDAFLTRIEDL